MSSKFLQARLEHQAAISKAISKQQPSAEDDEKEEEQEEDFSQALGKLVKGYRQQTTLSAGGNDNGQLGQQVADFMMSGLAACLVCIEEVKKSEATWCCSNCHGIFHLVCIQRWIREGVYQRVAADFNSQTSPPESLPWNCPKCRFEYVPRAAPTAYLCYCGKTRDPEPDPWLLPHSCGQICERTLKPACAHTCLLLCHPGPCPPCPAWVHTVCYCGKSNPTPHRCIDREWSCGNTCNKKLSCQNHVCKQTCHSGPCQPCSEKVTRSCRCGGKKELRPCSDGEWQCQQVCGKQLPCGRHVCKEVCHPPGPCPPCPLTLPRRCPCGKTTISGLSCDVDTTPACFETCGKLLACGEHRCYQRCHVGSCGECRETVRVKCRCGAKQRNTLCSQATSGEVTCETKCQRMRDCGRHPCKKKCCLPGSCPPCDNMCNRPLACGKHKCQSRCHSGRCYPCTEILKISCNCGKTSLRVPCGTKNVKPPRCTLLCQKPPNCRHEVVPHRCHFGDCPPCKKQCGAQLPGAKCGHFCEAVCHDFVLVQLRDEAKEAQLKAQPQGPWMLKSVDVRYERRSLPCPPCQHPVDVTCLGGHEITQMPCSTAKPDSCHRKCGKLLACTHHLCEKICHGINIRCDECDRACEQSRPTGCTHACTVGLCHPNTCPPCKRVVTKRCHCDQMLLGIECFKFTDESKKDALLSCGNRCARNMPCGHRCFSKCHPGQCDQVPDCAEMITRRCACCCIRETEPCGGRFINGKDPPVLPCNAACRARAAEKLKLKEQQQQKTLADSSPEVEQTPTDGEVRQRRRKNRNRGSEEDDDKKSILQKLTGIISLKQLIIITGVVVFFGTIAFILVKY